MNPQLSPMCLIVSGHVIKYLIDGYFARYERHWVWRYYAVFDSGSPIQDPTIVDNPSLHNNPHPRKNMSLCLV